MIPRTEDHRSWAYSPPSGCRWCGYGEYAHAQRWTAGGWHGYEPPTDEQIRDRMITRRAGRAVHPAGCLICDAARAAYEEIAARLDPLDNWPEVEIGGVTEQARVTALIAHALHQHFERAS